MNFEGPSKRSLMNCSSCARRGHASLILCIHIFPFLHTSTCEILKESANFNIVIGIQSSLSLKHWPSFEDEKEERVEIGGVNFHKKSCCVEKIAP